VHGVLQRFKVYQLLSNLEEEAQRLTNKIEKRRVENKKALIRASNVTVSSRKPILFYVYF